MKSVEPSACSSLIAPVGRGVGEGVWVAVCVAVGLGVEVGLGVNVKVGIGVSVANGFKPAAPWQASVAKARMAAKKLNF